MRTHPLLLAPLALLAACAPPIDEYRSILPDDRLLIDGLDGDAGALARGAGEPSEYYALTREVARDIDGAIGDVLGLIDEITAYDPTWTDDDARFDATTKLVGSLTRTHR